MDVIQLLLEQKESLDIVERESSAEFIIFYPKRSDSGRYIEQG